MSITKSTKKNVIFCLYQVKINETTCHISHLTSALSNSRMEKNGVMARHGHLSHIYFYLTPFILSTLVGAMLCSSIRTSVVLSTCNKSTTIEVIFFQAI